MVVCYDFERQQTGLGIAAGFSGLNFMGELTPTLPSHLTIRETSYFIERYHNALK